MAVSEQPQERPQERPQEEQQERPQEWPQEEPKPKGTVSGAFREISGKKKKTLTLGVAELLACTAGRLVRAAALTGRRDFELLGCSVDAGISSATIAGSLEATGGISVSRVSTKFRQVQCRQNEGFFEVSFGV